VFTATQEKREAARWMRTAEDRALLPDIGVFGQLQDDRNSFSDGKQNWAFGAMLKWGAFDPGRSKRLAAARADERAAELETRSAADQIRLEVEMAYRRAESAANATPRRPAGPRRVARRSASSRSGASPAWRR